jgi:parallel beta-helix repeat protein
VQIRGNSHHNLIENNIFGRAGHAAIHIERAHDNIIRRNLFSNDIQKNLEIAGRQDAGLTYRNLVEENVFIQAQWNPEYHGAMHIWLGAPQNIIRRNILRDADHYAMHCQVYDAGGGDIIWSCSQNHIYNNVFAHNLIDPDAEDDHYVTYFGGGFSLDDARQFGDTTPLEIRDNMLKNNIFYNNLPNNSQPDPAHPGRNILQIFINLDRQPNPPFNGNIFAGNLVYYQQPGEEVIYSTDAGAYPVAWFNTHYPQNFFSNIQLDPEFLVYNPGVPGDPLDGSYDFHLSAGSPAIDTGVHLTYTTASGSGTVIPVSDAGYFHDGYEGMIEADTIVVGGITVRITAIDYVNNRITVDHSISWSSNSPVDLPYLGLGPDMGVFER